MLLKFDYNSNFIFSFYNFYLYLGLEQDELIIQQHREIEKEVDGLHFFCKLV